MADLGIVPVQPTLGPDGDARPGEAVPVTATTAVPVAATTVQRAAEAAATAERRRIARELHDSVSQALFVLHRRAEVVERALDAGDETTLRAAAAGLREVSQQAIDELRAVLGDLRSAEAPAQGFGAALSALARWVRDTHELPVLVEVGADADAAVAGLGPEAARHLQRLVGEALHNTVKHARASGVLVHAAVEHGGPGRCLVVGVSDDGCGFPEPARPDPAETAAGRGHGQQTMRERARLCGGHLAVDSAAGEGTRVVVRIPLPGEGR
ncbi:histidine kinase/DNA gyrase B/HSP90-like ATPase [Kineococcus xinjiangensis]|uniref:Histidine kinase/DNA gyrase B/HSP90-like ATPase n=1 Tax=Kineococcus xinjiangensis TaxID=512762 RepID=A0A2S6IGU9_9ACTN|nr:histidine kinase [Kineococcus xinjiangensis]PPK93406.1 histidine kinase/DNA gyrase B/HSP90-like ATPase [Kineococcus xinjiangensis]